MMRSTIIAAILLALCAPAAAQCFKVTESAEQVFRAQLTKGERKAALREGAQRKCSTKPVPDGTEGAISADQARALVPEIRTHLRGLETKVTTKAKPKATRKRHRPRVVAQPRPRPAAAAQATPVASVNTIVPMVEHPLNWPITAIMPAPAPPDPPLLATPPMTELRTETKRERMRAWLRDVWRKIW